MSNNNSRALRRFHRARLIKKYTKYHIVCWVDSEEERKEFAARIVDHITLCSCNSCGNQRHNKWQAAKECLTMQERKAEEAFKYEMEELNGRDMPDLRASLWWRDARTSLEAKNV